MNTIKDFRPRLWPAVVIVLVAVAIVAAPPLLVPRTMMHFVAIVGGPVIATIGILIWWMIGSRAQGRDRWLPIIAFILPAVALYFLVYHSDETKGDLLKVLVYLAPAVAVLWVLWLVLTPSLLWANRGVGLLAVIVGSWAATSLIRIDGLDAEMIPAIRMAWSPTPAEMLQRELQANVLDPNQNRPNAVVAQTGDCPEFRGIARDGIARGSMRSNWKDNPPQEVWRHRVGAGWGAFAVVGEFAFTQEQRVNDECVVAYLANTGQQLWEYRVPGRFYETIAGAGPRGTPTVHEGKIYAFTAFGKLVCLDAATGTQIWIRDVIADVGATVPQWGFASSPLVIAGNVVVFTAAPEKGTAAYNALSGDLAWARGQGRHGYSSGQRFLFDGVEYVLMVSDFGLEAFDPKSGEPRGEFAWTFRGNNRVAQPTIIDGQSILIGTAVGEGQGAKRLAVSKDGDNLKFEKTWEGKSPKPYFNDGVVFEKHYYGFDDRNFVCVDLKNGKVKWNAGSKSGFGQVLLVPAQKMLMVQAESGGVLLVEANPEEYIEAAKLPVFKDKTWNHPVLVRGRLYLRNGVEAVCYDVSLPVK